MIKEQVGPKSFVFNFSIGTTPEEILTNLMDEVLAVDAGVAKHGWRLLDVVNNVAWNIFISETLITPVDVMFKKLYVIESDCLDGSVKRAIFGATADSILMLGLTQWDSTTKTSSDIKSLGFCSFVVLNNTRWNTPSIPYVYRILWGVKFRLENQTIYEKCTVALFVDPKWCAFSKVSTTFGITDTECVHYGIQNTFDSTVSNIRIQGLMGIFEHRNAGQGCSLHSYINSAVLGCNAGVITSNQVFGYSSSGCGVIIGDVDIFPGFTGFNSTYGNAHMSSGSNVVAMPAGHMTHFALGENLDEETASNAMGRAVKANKNPFTDTPTTNRIWLHQLENLGVSLGTKFRGEVFGLRCMSDESVGWMYKVKVVGEDRVTPESYFVIPSGLSHSPLDNQFILLVEA